MAEQALNSTSKIPQQPGNPPSLAWAMQQLYTVLPNPSYVALLKAHSACLYPKIQSS